MLVKEDFFDDNVESIINNNDSSEDLPDNDKNYQFSIEIKYLLNVTYDSIRSFDNADTVYKELNRLFKYTKTKYDVLLSINKHITDYRLSELMDTFYYDVYFNKTIQCYTLTIDFDLVPFKDDNELFYFFDSLCFENYRFKSNQSIRWSIQRFTIYKDNNLIEILKGVVTFKKIVNSTPLMTEMIEKTQNKINEDFFDDNDISVDPNQYMDDEQEEPVYEYHLQFIIHTWVFTKKEINAQNLENPYCFSDPEWKPVIESAFMLMKNALEYILEYTPVVTGYSPVRFCSKNPSVIETYPYMDNKPTFEYNFPLNKRAVLIETSINLSEKKDERKVEKLFHSFYRLQKIYDNLIVNVLKVKDCESAPHIAFGVFMEKPYRRSRLCYLMMSNNDVFYSDAQEMINILCEKD